jgi:toxin CcdB
MAQFDVYRCNKDGVEYLIDLQDEMLDGLSTRVVAPLVALSSVEARLKIVNPLITVDTRSCVMLTHLLAAIPLSSLGEPIATAGMQREEIVAALDLLFTGV